MVRLPFLRKKEVKEEVRIGKGFVPVDRVRELSERGFAESEIIDILRAEGFSPSEVDKALTQAIKLRVEEPAPKPPEKKEELKLPTVEEIKPKPPEAPKVPEVTLPAEYYPSTEYIDYVVRERMREVDTRLAEISRRYEELAKRITELDVSLREVTRARPEEEKLVVGRLAEVAENVKDMSIRLGSLEKAFKDTLPALIDSVRALTDLVESLRKKV
jgi:DNA-binding transcriptional MerR regulator